VQWLTVPYTSLPQRPLTAEDTQMNGQNLGFPANQIQTLANAGFAQRHPVVRRWLELVEIPIADLNAEYRYMRRNDASPADIRDRAQDWIAQHERQVERWLERARNAAR
jgi:glycine betaine/proline transport system substrate-binding protein